MASCLEVNNVPYRRVPAGMTSLPFSRYPLSYLPFSCLETPKVSGVIPLPETEKIFVSVSQRNSSPLLQSLRSAPRPIWSTDIFILHGAPSVGQNLPIASPTQPPVHLEYGWWGHPIRHSAFSRDCKITLHGAETDGELQ